jgi:hypothetical protein|tara:strand:+ start:743 stop:1396 length:654 start_codon:yes stop_codon:yes gene_type:complete
MSLLSTASPWDSKDSCCIKPKSRRKNCSASSESAIERSVKINEENSKRVNDLLNNMKNVSPDNDGKHLGNFHPPPPPQISDTDKTKTTEFTSPFKKEVSPNLNLHIYEGIDHTVQEGFTGNTVLKQPTARYQDSYKSNLTELVKPYMTATIASSVNDLGVNNNDKVLEKLNYMIQLLEEQQHEQTQHITEEFLLYTFLGVFVIYIVDSFSRAGKYIR